MTVYNFTNGYPSRGMDPQLVGETLDDLNERYGGVIPEVVVKAAKPKKSPLHRAFIWDDAEAAHKHRLRQAGHLIRAVVVESDTLPTVRRFVNVLLRDEQEDTSGRYYMTLDAALADEKARKYVLETAKNELASFRRKYGNLKEVAAVINAINRVIPKE